MSKSCDLNTHKSCDLNTHKSCDLNTHKSIFRFVNQFLLFPYLSHLMTKPAKWHVHTAKTQIRLGIVFAVCMKKAWVLSYPFSTQRRLIRLGKCPGWSESLLGTQIIFLVLTWGGSFTLCKYVGENKLSRALRKCVLCHIRTKKAQISLRICAVWSAPLLFTA